MTAQDVINQVSLDMRQVLSSTTDTNIIIPWIDRIQKDVLHTSLFNYLTRLNYGQSVSAGQTTVVLSGSGGPVHIRRLLSVYDRTFDRILLPYDNVAFPAIKADATSMPQAPAPPEAMVSAATMVQWPVYYTRLGTDTVILYPAPQKAAFAGNYEFIFENESPTITATTDTLLVPDDGMDLIVAGVNAYAAAYLKNPEDFSSWKSQYEAMKGGAFPA